MIRADQLNRLENLSVSPDEEAKLRCAYAKHYEDMQEFPKACLALGSFWTGIGLEPQTGTLSPFWAAEVWLRVGVLTGWRGIKDKVDTAQETAKNFITNSAEMFHEIGEPLKEAEAFVEMGICYWREGAFNEAHSYLNQAWEMTEDGDELRLRIVYNRSLVEWGKGKHRDALGIQEHAEPLFRDSTNCALKCRFYNAYAISLKTLGFAENREDYFDRAIEQYTASGIYAEQVGNTRHAGIVKSNLGSLYYSLKLYTKALEGLESAHKIFTRIKDQSLIGQSGDTRARVLLALNRTHEAEQVAGQNVKIFEGNGELSLLAESLTTQGVALARLKKVRPALTCLRRAAKLAKQSGDRNRAGIALLTILEEFPCLSYEVKANTHREAAEFLAGNQDASITERLEAYNQSLLMGASKEPKPVQIEELGSDAWDGLTLREARYKLEEWMLRRAILQAGGNFSRAARSLDITPGGLHDKVKNEYPHLKSLARTIHKTENKPKLPARLTLDLKQQTLVLKMRSEALSGIGIHKDDRLVVSAEEYPEEGLPAAVRFRGRTYVGIYREIGPDIELAPSANGYEVWTFEKASVDILGRVVAYMKAEDAARLKGGLQYISGPPFVSI